MLISVCISVMTGLWSMLSLKYIRLTIIANDRTQGCYFPKKGHVCWIIALRSIIQNALILFLKRISSLWPMINHTIFQKNWLIFTLIDNWSFNLTESALFPILNCWINTSYFYRVKYYLVKFTSDFSHFFRVFILKKNGTKILFKEYKQCECVAKNIIYFYFIYFTITKKKTVSKRVG